MVLKLNTLILLFFPIFVWAQNLEIIPLPNKIIHKEGYFEFNDQTEFVLSDSLFLNKTITNSISTLFNRTSINHINKPNYVELTVKKSLKEEEYELIVSK